MILMFIDESMSLISPSPEINTESNQLTNILRRTIARTIVRRHLIAETPVHYRVRADGVCGGPYVTGTGVSSRWQRR